MSLHPICRKIFERLIFDGMFQFFIENDQFLICPVLENICHGQLLSIIHEICKSFGEDYQVHNISFVYQEHLIKYRTYRLIFELEQNGMSGNWLVLRKFIELSWKPYLEHLYLFYSLIFKQTENKYLYWTVNLCGLRKFKSSSVVWPGLIFVPYSWQQCSTWHCVKVSVFGVILVRIFLHSDWKKYEKIRTRITPNTDTFYAVWTFIKFKK